MEKGNTTKIVKKKRGRPPKTKRLEEAEELTSNSLDATAADNTNASSSSPAETKPTSLDEPMALKLRTKYALAVPFEADRVDKANHVKVEAKDTHYDLESMIPDKIIEAQKGMTPPSNVRNQTNPRKNELNWGKSTSDIPARIPQPELPFQVMSEPEDPEIEVERYKVKKEVAPLLKAIFKKYGDIARKSLFSMESRSCLLEMVCTIYKWLEASDIMQLMPLELDSMKGQIKDLELVKVNVGWLQERLNQISKVMDMDFKGRGSIDIVINEKKSGDELRSDAAEGGSEAAAGKG